MSHQNGKPATGDGGLPNVSSSATAERSSEIATPRQVIRAELHGSSSCTAEGLTVKSPSPVIGLCKALVDAGVDPATPLEAWRGDVMCLRVPSIGGAVQLQKKPSISQLACTECGATTSAACNCGVAYVPAGTRAADAVAKNPEKSNVVLAEELGVGEATVRRARKKSTSSHDEVEKRTGKDGKSRKLPASRTPEQKQPAIQATLAILDPRRGPPPIEAARTEYLEAMADYSRADRIVEIAKLIAALGLRMADFMS
jgi:hypothetical protein